MKTTYGKGSSCATFSFAAALRVFLHSPITGQPLHYLFSGKPMLKDAIEALGIPHPEVCRVTLQGQVLPLTANLLPEQHLLVEAYTPGTAPYAGKSEDRAPAFVLDVHLGKLARELRLLGFDCLYRTHFQDVEIATVAKTEQRVVLTRDIGLLKLNQVQHGYWLRSQQAEEQLQEVLSHFGVLRFISPFTRCISCNGPIAEVPKEQVLNQLPPKTRLYYQQYYQCTNCGNVYWKGSHYQHMLERIIKLERGE